MADWSYECTGRFSESAIDFVENAKATQSRT
jgi:hypothetical protein